MSGKGDKQRPSLVDDQQVVDNWDRIFGKKEDDFWTHDCPMDRTSISIVKGQHCNWCGINENGELD